MPGFNDRLRLLRTSRGLSQSDLAKFLGISKSSVNMYERGEREPGLETLEAIGDFFNVDMDYLHGKSDIENRYRVDLELSSNNSTSKFTTSSFLCDDEIFPHLLKTYETLNTDGRQKVYERATELAELPKYQLTPATDTPNHGEDAYLKRIGISKDQLSANYDRSTTSLVAQDIILPTPEDTDGKK